MSLLNVGPFFITVPVLTTEMNLGICQAKLSRSNSVSGFYLQSSGVSSGQCAPPPWESRVVVLGGIPNISLSPNCSFLLCIGTQCSSIFVLKMP